MAFFDPYKILDVPRAANQAEIKAAYRKLAKQFHPDLNSADTGQLHERFTAVTRAYRVLGDPRLKLRFDRGELTAENLDAALRAAPVEEPVAATAKPAAAAPDRPAPPRPSYRPEVTKPPPQAKPQAEAAAAPPPRAEEAQARRAAAAAPPQPGTAERVLRTVLSFEDAARGIVRRIGLPDGSTAEIAFPAGTAQGARIRIAGRSDLSVDVQVEPHPHFQRLDLDVLMDLPITLGEALFGAAVTVPTIHGPAAVDVPAGSNTGDELRLAQRGIWEAEGGRRGDHSIRLLVVLPDDAMDLLRQRLADIPMGEGGALREEAGLS